MGNRSIGVVGSPCLEVEPLKLNGTCVVLDWPLKAAVEWRLPTVRMESMFVSEDGIEGGEMENREG